MASDGVSRNAGSVGRLAERQPLLFERPLNEAQGLRSESMKRRQLFGRDSSELVEGGVTGSDEGARGRRADASRQFVLVPSHRENSISEGAPERLIHM